MDLVNIHSGIYFVNLKVNGDVMRAKIVKQ